MATVNKAVLLLVSLISPCNAFWRMGCPGRLVLERIDPIVSPGAVSGHVHTVSGGSGFSFITTYEQQRASACSSCPIKQDLSAYWTPKLYYRAQNGTYEDVAQSGEGDIVTGGMTVYYQQRTGQKPGSKSSDKIHAFPPGFRMLAGDPFQRNATGLDAAPGNAVSFVCLDYAKGSTNSLNIPNKNCPDGLRAQIYFPSCWDGVRNDTRDHKSHMAYPIGHYDNGYCPDSHPVHLVSIFYEVIYSTGDFANRWYSRDGSHPFVFAQGDRTGYGFHGDFVNGWDPNVLQDAVDQCTANSGALQDCPVFAHDLFTTQECQSCMLPRSVNEPITGSLSALPGCNTPSAGPGYASPASGLSSACLANAVSISTPQKFFTDLTRTSRWAYVGCANDSISARTFRAASTSRSNMTVTACVEFCKSKGYPLAGLEYSTQCFCDSTYHSSAGDSRQPMPGILGLCGMPCGGDDGQVCGGPGALSVYRDCRRGGSGGGSSSSGGCANAEFEQFARGKQRG